MDFTTINTFLLINLHKMIASIRSKDNLIREKGMKAAYEQVLSEKEAY